MIARVAGMGSSFAGVAAYCLHDRREPGEAQPETAEQVEWTDTRNLPTSRGDRAAAVMAATAAAAIDLKRLAGGSLTGPKLQKPVFHYSLNWAKDETPDRQEMSRAVVESLTALGLKEHQALIVAHNDTPNAHVHVIVNRVNLETGKAAGLGRNHVTLSRWAEDYERRQGRIRCEQRVTNNAKRGRGKWVRDRGSLPAGRYRRERMSPALEPRFRQEWAELYARQRQQWEQLENAFRGVTGRAEQWWREHSALEAAQKAERVQLAAVHAAAAMELVEGEGEGGDMKPDPAVSGQTGTV